MPAHRAYADEIAERLDAARAVIAVWSQAAVKSHWVRSEADRARLNGTLVQVGIDDARLPMPFDRIQSINLCGWSGDPSAPAWRMVLDSVVHLVGGSAKPPASIAASPAVPAVPSVAVLPFKHLSADRDQDYFCEGIVEEVLEVLARLSGLRVAASAAMCGCLGSSAIETARALNVHAFLEGSVRKSGDRARIAVRLVQTGDGFTLWTESFERSLDDVFAVRANRAGDSRGTGWSSFWHGIRPISG